MNLPTLYRWPGSRASTYFHPTTPPHPTQLMSATTCVPVTSCRTSGRPTRTLIRSVRVDSGSPSALSGDPGQLGAGRGDGGATRYARPYRPMKPLLIICAWKARSVAHVRQRSVSGWARERRRADALGWWWCRLWWSVWEAGESGTVGETGELEREGTVLLPGVASSGVVVVVVVVVVVRGEDVGPVRRRRRNGMRSEGRRYRGKEGPSSEGIRGALGRLRAMSSPNMVAVAGGGLAGAAVVSARMRCSGFSSVLGATFLPVGGGLGRTDGTVPTSERVVEREWAGRWRGECWMLKV